MDLLRLEFSKGQLSVAENFFGSVELGSDNAKHLSSLAGPLFSVPIITALHGGASL